MTYSTTHACSIGRVGGLAVALGIGAAVAGLGGIAHADESAGATTNSESGSTAGTVDTRGGGVDAGPSAPNAPGAGGITSPSTARPDATDRPVTTKTSASDSATTDGDGPQGDVHSGSAGNGTRQASDRSAPDTTTSPRMRSKVSRQMPPRSTKRRSG